MSSRGGGMHMAILFNIPLKDELGLGVGGQGGIVYISLIFRLYYHVFKKNPAYISLFCIYFAYISLILLCLKKKTRLYYHFVTALLDNFGHFLAYISLIFRLYYHFVTSLLDKFGHFLAYIIILSQHSWTYSRLYFAYRA